MRNTLPVRPTAMRKACIGAGKGLRIPHSALRIGAGKGLRTPHSALRIGVLALLVLACQRDWKNPYDDANYNTPPTARVRLSHTAGTVDTLFIADASGSYDAEDSLSGLKFRWDWESDGIWDGDFSPSPLDSHMFSDGGVKAVKLAVMDRGGMSDTVIVALGINAAPVARFRATPRLNNFEYSVTVDASASTDLEDDASTFEYRWDFGNGDGWTAPSTTPTMVYNYVIADQNTVHRRTIMLEVRDSGGAVGTADTSVTVDFHPGMKLVPGGQFLMGSEFETDAQYNVNAGRGYYINELPVHPVGISAFWMDTVEVLQCDYEALIGFNPASSAGFASSGYPVDRVGWYDAVLYCNARSRRDGLDTVYTYGGRTEYRLPGIPGALTELIDVEIDYLATGYRLPTEAEWEYACRAGSDGMFCFGNDTLLLGSYGWYYDNSNVNPQAVAQKQPNAWGMYDMHGNLDEYCNDWYGVFSSSTALVVDPHGPAEPAVPGQRMKVVKGGGFESTFPFMRSAMRAPMFPYLIDSYVGVVGFRVVLPVQ